MRTLSFIVFFSVFLLIYGSSNYYIFIRGLQSLPKISSVRIIYVAIFLFISLSFIAGRVLEKYFICGFSEIMIWIGSFWFGFMLYFFLSIVFIDILRLADKLFFIFPALITSNPAASRLVAMIFVLIVSSIAVGIGAYNASSPKVKTLEIELPRKGSKIKSLKVALASDIHLGTIIKNSRLETLIDTVNSLNPDIILLAGDIVDEDIAPVIKNNLGETLRGFKSKYGVYAVTGNHEFIGGADAACEYLEAHGIRMLRDKTDKINDSFYLAGREDAAKLNFTNKPRLPLEEVIKDADKNYPIILMDHSPFKVDEAVSNGIDLMLSGHTHNGQLWPINYIVGLIFKVSYGLEEFGATKVYVSCGYGTWGPPARLGSTPELVEMNIRFVD
jgi:uncharacterized protein